MSAEKLLTPEDVTKALSVKPETVREWLRTGKLKGVKVGRLWRVRESDLEEFLSGGESGRGELVYKEFDPDVHVVETPDNLKEKKE